MTWLQGWPAESHVVGPQGSTNEILVDVGKACKYTGSVPPAMSMSFKGHKAAASPGSHITFSIYRIYTPFNTLFLSLLCTLGDTRYWCISCVMKLSTNTSLRIVIASYSVDCINLFLVVDWRSNEILTLITHNSYMQFYTIQHTLHDLQRKEILIRRWLGLC